MDSVLHFAEPPVSGFMLFGEYIKASVNPELRAEFGQECQIMLDAMGNFKIFSKPLVSCAPMYL